MKVAAFVTVALLAVLAIAADKVISLNPGEPFPTRIVVTSGDSQAIYNPTSLPSLPQTQPAPPAAAVEDFSEPPLAPGAQRIYVANNGNDNNPGTVLAPYATLQKAAYMVRTGKGDRVYARCGDTFYGTVMFNGSGIEGFPCGFWTYGTGPRPHLLTSGSGFLVNKPNVKHFGIVGYHITAQNRNPNDPKFNLQAPLTVGVDVRHNNCADWLVDDCKIEFFDDGVATQADGLEKAPKETWQSNVTIRRCIIVDSWGTGQFDGQGVYISNVSGLLIENNFFDHNGWNEQIAAVQTRKLYAHAAYISVVNDNCIVRGNYVSRSAGYGIQQRCGGECAGNVLYMNGLAALGSSARFNFHDNVIMGGQIENMKAPFGAPGVGHGGVELAAHEDFATNNYFWGLPLNQIPGGPVTYVPPAFQVNRRDWTTAGTISFVLSGNAIWNWPSVDGTPNELTLYAPPGMLLDRKTNPPMNAPATNEVWPSNADLSAMRTRTRAQSLPQLSAATIVSKFAKGR